MVTYNIHITLHPAASQGQVHVDPCLVELLCRNMPYDELVGYYDFTDEEINAASYYISHTAPDDILAMLEELAYMKEEEEGWTW